MIRLCDYGCGQEAKYQFKNGKFCCSEHFSSCSYMKYRNKISNENRDYETIKKMKSAWKKRKCSNNYKNQQKDRGRKQSKIVKKLWESGIYDSDEYRKKLSTAIKKIWKDPNSIYNSEKWRKQQSENTKLLFQDEEFIKKYKQGMKQTPNKPEQMLVEVLKEMNLFDYEFVGDHSLWIGGRNPDFINDKSKKIIEIFGNYWHSEEITGRSVIEEELQRQEHFKKFGFNTLIIWEDELKNIDDLKRKIRRFVR